MLKFLFNWILSFFFSKDVSITINGSTITFTKKGDIILQPQRCLISKYKYNFMNCTEKEITDILFNIPLEKENQNVSSN